MENKEIISKIKELAYENVNKKLEQERLETERKISQDLENVSKCLKYIENRMVFKIIKDSFYNPKKYVLATEEMFLEDYNKECGKYYEKGIKFKNKNDKPYYPIFEVNGESYYEIENVIYKYNEDFELYKNKLNRLTDSFHEIEEAVISLKLKEPMIKELLENYKKVDIESEE